MGSRPSCRELVECLADYLSGALPSDALSACGRHLATCPSCANYAKSYMETIRLGKAVLRFGDEPAPVEVPEELVQAILEARERAS